MVRPGKARPKGKSRPNGAPSSSGKSGKRIESYEDTIEPGGVDDLIFQRDQILFDDSTNTLQEDDINADQGEEVLAMPEYGNGLEHGDEEYEEDYAPAESSSSKRKGKAKVVDTTKRGRFSKEDVADDEEGSEEGSSSDEGGWGRQYYSKPSNRRAKEDPTQYEASREEERELEENEVKRLQKKARSGLQGVTDWGFDAAAVVIIAPPEEVEEIVVETVEAPQTDDPAALLRHMETHDALKLALARELPLVIERLEKTSRGIKALHENQTSEGTMQKGLGWLHYQILLTYSSTLAYYVHLCALPADSRPNLTDHPILERLLKLKEGLALLEDLDFAADSESDEGEEEEMDEDEAELLQNKRDLMARMYELGGAASDGAQSEEDLDESWRIADLEEGELDALLAEAQGSDLDDLMAGAEGTTEFALDHEILDSVRKMKKRKGKKTHVPLDEAALGGLAEPDFDGQNEHMPDLPASNGTSGSGEVAKNKKPKKAKVTSGEPSFRGLVEPDFSSISFARPIKSGRYDDVIGDPASLDEADASDKEHRKRSLQFHTSRINSTSARRNAARAQRYGGDDDIPHRDRQAARDAVLRRSGPSAPLEDDDMSGQWLQDKDESMEVSEDTGYYELVRRNQAQKKAAKDAAHLEAQSTNQRVSEDAHEGGPRALTRAIEKNRGLTPRRSKTSRNPRVKKRLAYDKAKKKVSSQGPVYKGGQSTLPGRYSGETSGISSNVRSKRF